MSSLEGLERALSVGLLEWMFEFDRKSSSGHRWWRESLTGVEREWCLSLRTSGDRRERWVKHEARIEQCFLSIPMPSVHIFSRREGISSLSLSTSIQSNASDLWRHLSKRIDIRASQSPVCCLSHLITSMSSITPS